MNPADILLAAMTLAEGWLAVLEPANGSVVSVEPEDWWSFEEISSTSSADVDCTSAIEGTAVD